MKRSTFALSALLLAMTSSAFAQQSQITTTEPKASGLTQQEIGSEKITLVRDANLPVGQANTPTQSLSRQYATQSPDQVTGPDNNPLDINKIRVITPAQFATLAPDAQTAIKADPYYVISDKSRMEVMAEFIKTNAQDDLSRSLHQSAPAVAAPSEYEGMPTQAEKDSQKAAENAGQAKP